MTTGSTTHDAPDAEVERLLADAVEPARAAALEVGGESVGEHLGVRAETAVPDDGAAVATHAFAATLPGYAGWHWAVTVVRAAGSDDVTVDEVVLLPGEGALIAPPWVPWQQRVRPGDLAPGDLVPPPTEDDPQVEAVAFELGLGRERVLSREGRLLAAERWHDGDRGPDTAMARHAPARCGTCGFYLPLAGSLSAAFGACGNDITETDGQIVSVDYGCGAHSQVKLQPSALAETGEVVYDDGEEFAES